MKATEKKIIEETIRCVGTLGSDQTNARVVAERLKIQPSNVFYYFPKQQQLFEAMVTYIVEINRAFVTNKIVKKKTKTNRATLQSYIEGNLEWAAKNPDQVAALMFGFTSAVHSTFMSQLMRLALTNGEDTIYQYLALGVAEKEFEVKGSIRESARSIHQMLTGSIVNMYVHRNSGELALYEARVTACFENLLN